MTPKTYGSLPQFHELPAFAGMPGCAWGVWGKGDELGTVNLLTDELVVRAAREEIKMGKAVCLNWPLQFPAKPLFRRKAPEHTIIRCPAADTDLVRDDELHINTQSGSQWDGLKHAGILSERCFYQGIRADDVPLGKTDFAASMDEEAIRSGIHNMAEHGVCGRGVLVDLVKFYTAKGTNDLPYDPFASHSIPLSDIKAAAEQQGVTFRRGDILLLRMGFTQKYSNCSEEERDKLGSHERRLTPCAGIEQSEEMAAFLWNNHFAAIASDQPALERYPPPKGKTSMHEVMQVIIHAEHDDLFRMIQTILGLFGMPIGELFDLEELAKVSNELNRYTFFFTSWPLRILGGIASPPNAAATF